MPHSYVNLDDAPSAGELAWEAEQERRREVGSTPCWACGYLPRENHDANGCPALTAEDNKEEGYTE